MKKENELKNLEKSIGEQEIQVKSKQRVKDHGEVFTNKREVNAMLDLVKDESYKVSSRFLEPACGNGNFLVEILNRKLQTVLLYHNSSQTEFEKNTFLAVSTIYAIDIQEDNCEESRERMYQIVKNLYTKEYAHSVNKEFLDSIKTLLQLNVILGDGLTGLQVEGNQGEPIVFSEFTFDGDSVVRKDFSMNGMIAHEERKSTNEKVTSTGLFGMIEQEEKEEELKPLKEFKFENIYKITE